MVARHEWDIIGGQQSHLWKQDDLQTSVLLYGVSAGAYRLSKELNQCILYLKE